MRFGHASTIAFLILLAFFLIPLPASGQNIVQIDYPGQVLWTEIREINNLGEMAGRYIDSNQVIHAFTLNNGTFTNIDVPGATQTAAWGIIQRRTGIDAPGE